MIFDIARSESVFHRVLANDRTAFRELVLGLRERSPCAVGLLGALYMTGTGLPHSPARAERRLRHAAKRGDALAAHNLTTLYVADLAHTPDASVLARTWSKVASDLGFSIRSPGK